MKVKIEESWKGRLKEAFETPTFKELGAFVKKEYAQGAVYPAPKHIFRAFDLTPFEKVKVVILGQDPYHGKGQANGLCFAVQEGVALPPSLQNIFKEIESDVGEPPKNRSGDLSRWAEQGVLLLNATLTVRANTAGSHQGRVWRSLLTLAFARFLKNARISCLFSGAIMQGKKVRISTAQNIW